MIVCMNTLSGTWNTANPFFVSLEIEYFDYDMYLLVAIWLISHEYFVKTDSFECKELA